jgi:hypothetical protein
MQPVALRPSASELAASRLNQRTIQEALEALNGDGLVVVENVVETAVINKLNTAMVADARTLMARGSDGPFNYNLGNLQQSPPYNPELFASSIFANPIAIQITNAWLGERPTMSFISSNVAVKADVGQPVHSDADFDHPSVSTTLETLLMEGSLCGGGKRRSGGHVPRERLNSCFEIPFRRC